MLARKEPGFEGSELIIRERPIPGTRLADRTVFRAPKDTFVYRYASARPHTMKDVLYEAGCRYARLRERCGLDAPGPVDLTKVGLTQFAGVPLTRLEAQDEFKGILRGLGKEAGPICSRLDRYIVFGQTVVKIARIYGRSNREMGSRLENDLALLALHFRMLTET